MAATIETTKKSAEIIAFPSPMRAVENRDAKKRLPQLSSTQIEDIFAHAESLTTTLKRAA